MVRLLQGMSPECSRPPRSNPCMAHPVLDRLLIQYHSLGIASFIRQTYQAGIPHLHAVCYSLFINLLQVMNRGYSRKPCEEAGKRFRCCVTTAGWWHTVGTSAGTEPSRMRALLEALLGGRVVVFLAVSWFVDGGVFPEQVDGGGATLQA